MMVIQTKDRSLKCGSAVVIFLKTFWYLSLTNLKSLPKRDVGIHFLDTSTGFIADHLSGLCRGLFDPSCIRIGTHYVYALYRNGSMALDSQDQGKSPTSLHNRDFKLLNPNTKAQ